MVKIKYKVLEYIDYDESILRKELDLVISNYASTTYELELIDDSIVISIITDESNVDLLKIKIEQLIKQFTPFFKSTLTNYERKVQ